MNSILNLKYISILNINVKKAHWFQEALKEAHNVCKKSSCNVPFWRGF